MSNQPVTFINYGNLGLVAKLDYWKGFKQYLLKSGLGVRKQNTVETLHKMTMWWTKKTFAPDIQAILYKQIRYLEKRTKNTHTDILKRDRVIASFLIT